MNSNAKPHTVPLGVMRFACFGKGRSVNRGMQLASLTAETRELLVLHLNASIKCCDKLSRVERVRSLSLIHKRYLDVGLEERSLSADFGLEAE